MADLIRKLRDIDVTDVSVLGNTLTQLLPRSTDVEMRRKFVESAAVKELVRFLESGEPAIQVRVIALLMNLSLDPAVAKQVREFGGLRRLVLYARSSPDRNIVEYSIGALLNCAKDDANKDIIRNEGGLRLFLSLIEDSRSDSPIRANCLAGIGIMCSLEENRKYFQQNGGIPILLKLLRESQDINVQIRLTQALANLAADDDIAKELAKAKIMTPLMQMTKSPDSRLQRTAATLLQIIDIGDIESEDPESAMSQLDQIISDMRSTDENTQFNAVGMFWNYAKKESNWALLREKEVPRLLVTLLRSDFAETLERVAGVVCLLAEDKSNCALFGSLGAIPLLLRILKVPDEDELVANAISALGNLAFDAQNRTVMRNADILNRLVQVLNKQKHGDLVAQFMVIFSGDDESRRQLITSPMLAALFSLLDSEDDRTRYQAAAALWNAANNDEVLKVTYENGAILKMAKMLPSTDLASANELTRNRKRDRETTVVQTANEMRREEQMKRPRGEENDAETPSQGEPSSPLPAEPDGSKQPPTPGQVEAPSSETPATQSPPLLSNDDDQDDPVIRLEAAPDSELVRNDEPAVSKPLERDDSIYEKLRKQALQEEERKRSLQLQEKAHERQEKLRELERKRNELESKKKRIEEEKRKTEEDRKRMEQERIAKEKKLAEEKQKKIAKRSKICQELLETEKDYVTSLRRIREVFMWPLLTTEKGVLSKDRFTKMFGDIEIILMINEDFYQDLQKLFGNKEVPLTGNEEEFLGTLFLKRSPVFKLYTTYINNYDTSTEVLMQEMQKNKKFTAFLEQATNLLMEQGMRKTDLESYLILPIQRLPRYSLLLTDLKKHSDLKEGAPGLVILESALDQIKDITNYCNERKRDMENRSRVAALQREFAVKKSNPARKLVKEDLKGNLEIHKSVSTKHLVKSVVAGKGNGRMALFNDSVAIAKQGRTVTKKKTMWFALDDGSTRLDEVDSDIDKDNCRFNICTNENTITIVCVSTEERNAWITTIQGVINDCKFAERQSRRITASMDFQKLRESVQLSDMKEGGTAVYFE